MIHLDTNIVSYALKKVSSKLLNRIVHAAKTQGIAISATVYAELRFGMKRGALNAQHNAEFDEMCSYINVLDWTRDCAEVYAETRAHLASTGQLIGAMDLMIAAHALASNAILVTNNESEFRRVPGLKVENWMK